ncbi:MAG: dipeptidase [Planctomycetaceae bacterium]
MEGALRYLEANRERFLELLLDYLRIASVSAQRDRHPDARRAAEFVRARLEAAGLQAGLFQGDGLPTVHGRCGEGAGRPTLLVYGHYDVQPPEPLELWESPPFEPVVKEGEIRARGCADDKGPSLAMVFAAECWTRGEGGLPTNLRFIIEGEEECGGSVVQSYLEKHKESLAADALVIADTSGVEKGVPALVYGLRGIVAAEVLLTGPTRDLHSGSYGGTVANPATALGRLIASLHDRRGTVAISGFYGAVKPLDAPERARLAKIPFVETEFLAETGSPSLFGEEGYTSTEREAARPTCEINGIYGGYQGEGSKTIIPSRAGCKITCRLVPDQEPEAIKEALRLHLEKHLPPGVRMELRMGHGAPPVFTDPETRWAKIARASLESAFGKPCALSRGGGSIPVLALFQKLLRVQPLLLGTYAPGERAHSPNERYFVDDLYAGIRTGIHLFAGK